MSSDIKLPITQGHDLPNVINLRKIAIIGGDEYGFVLQSDRVVEGVEVVTTLQSLDC